MVGHRDEAPLLYLVFRAAEILRVPMWDLMDKSMAWVELALEIATLRAEVQRFG